MNNFEYQKKAKTSEEAANSFKDFNKVLKKHNSISSAYKSIWKYVFITTGLAGASVVFLFFYTNSYENNLPKNTSKNAIQTSIKKEIKHHNIERLQQKKDIEVIVVENVISEPVRPEKKEQKKESGTLIDSNEFLVFDTTKFEKETHLDTWYTLNEKPEKEIIKLPTLFVSNIAWPNNIDKTKIVKLPSIIAFYEKINQEIPIVNGTAYITTDDATEKPIGYKLNGNIFPAGLIREIHKADETCILLLKNIEMYIPGRGRTNIGDKRIEINLDKKYLNRF